MSEIRVTTTPVGVITPSRTVPLDHLLITGTSSGAANTFYTVRTGALLKVHRLSVVNLTGGAVTLSLNSIPPGGSIGDANAELRALSIAANTAMDLTDYIGGVYVSGTVLKAYSGTTNALVLHGWAEEIL